LVSVIWVIRAFLYGARITCGFTFFAVVVVQAQRFEFSYKFFGRFFNKLFVCGRSEGMM
jgi:hypothetical protein